MSEVLEIPKTTLDIAGATASLLCAVHCALMPVLLVVIPWLHTSIFASEGMEWCLVLSTGLLASISIRRGFGLHGSHATVYVLALGMLLLVGGRICEYWEISSLGMPMLVFGGLLLMSAHLLNLRLCRGCPACIEEQ